MSNRVQQNRVQEFSTTALQTLSHARSGFSRKGHPLGSLNRSRLLIKLFSFLGGKRFGFQVIYQNGLKACTPRSQLL